MNNGDEGKGPVMDLTMLHEAFGVPEEDGLGLLMAVARREHYTLAGLVLSVIERAGVAMGPVARAELQRGRERAAHYRALLDEVAAHVHLDVIKGPNVSRYYPDGVFRPQGDLDLVTRDEKDLWTVARLLARKNPPHVAVSVFGAPRPGVTRVTEVMVTMTWDAKEPLVDPPFKVDLSTAALTGDFGAVPVRRTPPRPGPVGVLLCIAEERLQRPFHVRDALDVSMLSHTGMAIPEIVAEAAAYRLAPELAELLRYSASRVPLPGLADLATALAPEVERERLRRAAEPGRLGSNEAGGAVAALAEGRPVHGMLLSQASDRTDWETSTMHVFGADALLLTPLGDYLLVEGALVDPQRYEAALAALAALEGVRP